MLMRFDPYRTLDRLVHQSFGTSSFPVTMHMDVHRDDDKYVITLDLPGIDPAKIDVSVHGDTLSVTAERSFEKTKKGADGETLLAERQYGKFRRELQLGDGVDAGNIAASYENGVLTVTVPVAASAKPRKIEILSSEDKTKSVQGGTAAA